MWCRGNTYLLVFCARWTDGWGGRGIRLGFIHDGTWIRSYERAAEEERGCWQMGTFTVDVRAGGG